MTGRQAVALEGAPADRAVPRAGILQRRCACGTHSPGGGACGACARKKGILQRRQADGGPGAAAAPAAWTAGEAAATDLSAVPAYGSPPTGSGRPLEPSVAARYRSGLGPLVDAVRIHDDSAAATMARREGAVAFTSGANIYFAASAYRPHSRSGRNLLSHELAHVWQQHRSDGPPAGYQSRPGDRYEQEADRIAASEAFTPSDGAGARSGVRQSRTAMEQVATELRNAVEGPGTDEQAIFNALAGRTPAQIAEIEAAYAQLSGGETLEARLRDELSGDELSRAMSLLRGESAATEAARQIWDAVDGLGTDEAAIYAALAGRSAEQWQAIQDAYRQMANEGLVARLQDELTADEWTHAQTLLPGAVGGAQTAEDRATVAANQIQHAVDGPGTDEDAIYSALTGRTEPELREIAQRYRLLTGEEMEARLRDELTDREYESVQLLLHPQALPDRVARELHNAVQGPGTRESEIMAILTGRSTAELPLISAAYQRLYSESLTARLTEELDGADRDQALQLLRTGVLEPADEINLAVEGLGTDEERLFAVLTEISTSRATVVATIDRYASKGYGDMLAEVADDLSGDDLARAMELLHGQTPTGTCSAEQRSVGLEAMSGAASLAQNAASRLDAEVAAGRLSSGVTSALNDNFNPGRAAGAVTLAIAGQISTIFTQTRGDILSRGALTCTTPAPPPCAVTKECDPDPDCSKPFMYAWTCSGAGSVVRLCPALFDCAQDKPRSLLHEFVHHTGVLDKFYQSDSGFASLTPRGDRSATDSLDNADSYAYFARAVY